MWCDKHTQMYVRVEDSINSSNYGILENSKWLVEKKQGTWNKFNYLQIEVEPMDLSKTTLYSAQRNCFKLQ